MKIKTTAFLAALVLSLGLQAAWAQKGLKVGVFALPQTTWLLNDDDISAAQDEFSYQTTFGMAVGVMGGYNFTENLGVRANLVYSVQGQRHDALNSEGDWVNYTRRLHYLKVPVMVGFNTNTEINKIVFNLHAGFYAGFLLAANNTDDDQSYVPDISLYDNVYDYPQDYYLYNFIDYGPIVETGIDIKLRYNVMGNIYLRADYSLADAENKDAAYKRVDAGVPRNVLIYDESRPETTNFTGGILIGLTYTFTDQ